MLSQVFPLHTEIFKRIFSSATSDSQRQTMHTVGGVTAGDFETEAGTAAREALEAAAGVNQSPARRLLLRAPRELLLWNSAAWLHNLHVEVRVLAIRESVVC